MLRDGENVVCMPSGNRPLRGTVLGGKNVFGQYSVVIGKWCRTYNEEDIAKEGDVERILDIFTKRKENEIDRHKRELAEIEEYLKQALGQQ